MTFLKIRYNDFISSPVEWGSCILNIILCLCMGYFYFDSEIIAPLVYSIFFFLYIIVVFFSGKRFIPLMYLLYCFGGVQDITFINLTGWFIVIGLSWWFPKWKIPIMVVYVLEIFFVCFRHSKSVWHLLAHFAFCVVFYVVTECVKNKIQNDVIKSEKEKIRAEVEADISGKIRNELKEEIRNSIKPLNLTSGEDTVLSQLADGKLIKEVQGVSKNTKTDYIESAMLKNGCKNKSELIALYSLNRRLPELFPSLFP